MTTTEFVMTMILAMATTAFIVVMVAIVADPTIKSASLDCWSGTQLVYTGEASDVRITGNVTTFKVGESTHKTNAVCFLEQN